MTRTGPSKKVEPAVSEGRLAKAMSFHKAASDGLAMLEEGGVADPIVSNIVLAAVGYADALTAKFGGKLNQKDHGSVTKLLREVLGQRLPAEQVTRIERILGRKDEAQYGITFVRKETAARLHADLEKFAAWAKASLAGKRS